MPAAKAQSMACCDSRHLQQHDHRNSTRQSQLQSHHPTLVNSYGLARNPQANKNRQREKLCFQTSPRICQQMEHHLKGIPYNSTGQAIVERVNQTLKSKLETIAKAEGFTNAIPQPDQPRLLATALLALNQFPRGDQNQAPSQKHWAVEANKEGPPACCHDPPRQPHVPSSRLSVLLLPGPLFVGRAGGSRTGSGVVAGGSDCGIGSFPLFAQRP